MPVSPTGQIINDQGVPTGGNVPVGQPSFMSGLTPEQQTLYNNALSLAPATPPSTASGVNPVASVQFPQTRTTTQDNSQAVSFASGEKAAIKSAQDIYNQQLQQAQEAQKQSQELQKQNTGILSQLLGQPTRQDIQTSTEQQYGVNRQEFLARRSQSLAEIEALNKEYATAVEQEEAQIAALEGQGRGIPIDLLNNQAAQIRRNNAPRLNRIAANVNAKAAVMAAQREDFELVSGFVDKAVEAASADAKDRRDTILTFYQANQDTISRLDSQYQDAMKFAVGRADQAYNVSLQENKLKGEMITEAAKYGVDLSGYMDKPLSEVQKIYGSRVAPAALKTTTGTNMTPRQVATFNQIVNKASSSPLVAANDRAVILKSVTEELSKDPTNSALQASFIYGMIQALDTYQSAVREGEIGFIQSTQGLKQKIENLPAQIESGTILSKSKVEQYVATARMLTGTIETAANRKLEQFKSQATVSGVGPAWDEYIAGAGLGETQQTYEPGETLYIDGVAHLVLDDGTAAPFNELFTPMSQ